MTPDSANLPEADWGASSPSIGTPRLNGLDALRGLAALIVLSFHMSLSFAVPKLFPYGYFAVDFFFLLSGYVMARTYEGKLGKELSSWTFFGKRYARMWPTMAVGGLIGLPFLFAADPERAPIIAALNFLLLPSFGHDVMFPLNGPAWSIFFELFANLVHAVLLWKLRTRTLLFAVLAACTIYVGMFPLYGNLSFGPVQAGFYGGSVRVLTSYMAGILFYRCWRDVPPIRISWPVTLLLMPAALAGFTAGYAPVWLAHAVFVTLVCPLVLMGGLGWRAGRWADLTGALSFPLYATHVPVIMVCMALDYGAFVTISLCFLTAGLLLIAGKARKSGFRQLMILRRKGQLSIPA
jgi:peptidoglycan/LPS O-acetylase OafA/YrhL